MKDLVCYISEKLTISKNALLNNSSYFKVNIPRCTDDDVYRGNLKQLPVWRTWDMPRAEYIIYVDYYRHRIPHLAFIGEFIESVCIWESDYESFDPKKDILYSSDDQDDIMHWYIEEYLKCPYPQKGDDKYEWVDTCEKILDNQNSPIIDNLDVLFDFATGKDKIENDWKFDFNDPIGSIDKRY